MKIYNKGYSSVLLSSLKLSAHSIVQSQYIFLLTWRQYILGMFFLDKTEKIHKYKDKNNFNGAEVLLKHVL